MITICLSTYNGSQYLPQFLASLERQTYQDWNLIIRDDGSTDDTLQIIDEFGARFPGKIEWHQSQGHHVVVVSASLECWLRPWCEQNTLELIATRLDITDGKVSGRLLSKNCYGIEKANRIKEKFDLNQFDTVYAYGDSRGDKEMLDLAHEKHYKPFR